jgi:hypothetical protein
MSGALAVRVSSLKQVGVLVATERPAPQPLYTVLRWEHLVLRWGKKI